MLASTPQLAHLKGVPLTKSTRLWNSVVPTEMKQHCPSAALGLGILAAAGHAAGHAPSESVPVPTGALWSSRHGCAV